MNDDVATAVSEPELEIPPIVSGEDFERSTSALIAPPFKSKFGALFLNDLDAPGPEFEWLINGWLSIGDKSIIGGPSQSGKSFLAIHASLCIAFGLDFFGSQVKQGLVIYIAGEGARGVKKRLRAWRKQFGVEYGRDTPFVLLQTPVNLYAADGSDTNALIAEIKAICAHFPDVQLRLVVVDTLATAAVGADENHARDMGIVMSNVGKLNEVTRSHIMLVHHMSAGGTKLRGSTAIYAALDNTIFVTQSEETKIRTAKLGKQKDDECDLSFKFELMAVEVGRDATDRPITSCVCLPVGQKDAIRKSEEAKGFSLTTDETLFMQAFFEAEKKFGQPVPADMQIQENVRTIVPYIEVRRIFAGMNPPDDDEAKDGETSAALAKRRRERLKKVLERIRKKLMQLRVIEARKREAPNADDKDAPPVDQSVIWWTGKPLRAFPHTMPRAAAPVPATPAESSFGQDDDVGF